MDLDQRNDLRLAALKRVSPDDRKKHQLGRLLEVSGDARETAIYFLDFNLVHDVKWPALKVKGLADLPLGIRANTTFGNPGDINVSKVREFLARPELGRVRGLDLRGVDLGPASAAFAKADLSSLRWLHVGGTAIKLASFVGAKSLGALERLVLGANGLDAEGLGAVVDSPTLAKVTSLELWGSDLSDDEDFDKVVASPGMGRFEELVVRGTNRESWAALAKSRHVGRLRRLDLNLEPRDGSSALILTSKGLSRLEDLKLLYYKGRYKNAALPALRRLHINTDSEDVVRGLAADAALGHLDHLGLEMTWKAYAGIPDLYASAGFRKLSSLDLVLNQGFRSAEDAALVCTLPAFERLRALRILGPVKADVTVGQMIKNRPFRALEELAIDPDLGPDGARALAACADLGGLQQLRVTVGTVHDQGGAASLAESPHLRSLRALDLGRTRIGNDNLQALLESDNFKHLISLDISSADDPSPKLKAALLAHKKMPRLWKLSGVGLPDQPDMRT